MRRRVKVYHVTEGELMNIATGNTVSRWSASAGWGLISFGIGIVLSLIVEKDVSELATALAWYVVPICASLAIVCFCVWYFTKEKRESDLDSILCPAEETEL